MSMRQKSMNSRSMRHAVAASTTHAEDKDVAARRRHVEWIPYEIEVAEGNGKKVEHGLGPGFQFTSKNGQWREADEVGFVKHLKCITESRNWYRGTMSRKGRKCEVRRKRPQVLEQMCVTFSPWASGFLRRICLSDNGKFRPTIRDFLSRAAQLASNSFEERTGREVVGCAVHLDTAVDHLHLQFTRVSKDNELLGETRGLHTIGAWACGVKRQLDVGAIDADSEKARLTQRNLALFAERHGGEIPLDVQLNEVIDSEFEKIFGAVPLATDYKQAYAQNVRTRESRVLEEKEADLMTQLDTVRHEMNSRRRNDLAERLRDAKVKMDESAPRDLERGISAPDLDIEGP